MKMGKCSDEKDKASAFHNITLQTLFYDSCRKMHPKKHQFSFINIKT